MDLLQRLGWILLAASLVGAGLVSVTGYLLVRMFMDDDSWAVVRNTPGVTGFVGNANKPTPLSRREVERIRADYPQRNDQQWLKRTLAYWPQGADMPRLEYETVKITELPPGDRGYGAMPIKGD